MSRSARPPRPGGEDAWCYVGADELHMLDQTLTRFLAGLRGPDVADWRASFADAVSRAASIVLEHTRPPYVQVRLVANRTGVTAQIREGGRWWLGEPGPANALDGLAEGDVLDGVRYEPVGELGHRWILHRRARGGLASQPERPEQPGPVEAGASDRGALGRLARAAAHVARAPREARIPYLDRSGDLGRLARGLRSLQDIAVQRLALDLMIAEAPLGIASIGPDERYRYVNRAYAAMRGYRTPDELVGRLVIDDMSPEMQASNRTRFLDFWEGREGHLQVHNRHVAPDGTIAWHTTLIAPSPGPPGRPESMLLFTQDTTEPTRQQERAAQVQRDLLPATPPRIDGYELAGACMPAENMSGDFFDWVLRDDGQLDITIADVMGKGMAAALVMAALRTGLRAAADPLGPAQRVRTVAASLALSRDDGLFVTLFQARLDLASGSVRYVDAGHGYWAILRADGRLEQTDGRSLPLLVMPEVDVEEREARLEPGDTLVLYSDGLVERAGETVSLCDYRQEMDRAEDAQAIVQRLLGTVAPTLSDDVTVVALRRHPAGAGPHAQH